MAKQAFASVMSSPAGKSPHTRLIKLQKGKRSPSPTAHVKEGHGLERRASESLLMSGGAVDLSMNLPAPAYHRNSVSHPLARSRSESGTTLMSLCCCPCRCESCWYA